MNILVGLVIVAGITAGDISRGGEAAPTLPVQVEDEKWQPLGKTLDRRLQSSLELSVRERPGWAKLIKRKKLAVALVDISDPVKPRFARINGNKMMYAASLPKIAILLAAVDALESGRLKLDEQLDQDLNNMIRSSSNKAAARVSDRLGGLDRVNAILKDSRFKFYDENMGGGLWVGKRYAKKGRRRPDPMNGISHGATATQVARFYYRMATGRLISPRASRRMLEYMVDPGVHHKFVNTLELEAPEATLYRKSGTWRHWHADSVLVWGGNWRRYILVGMVEDPNGEAILRGLVRVAEQALQAGHPLPVRNLEE